MALAPNRERATSVARYHENMTESPNDNSIAQHYRDRDLRQLPHRKIQNVCCIGAGYVGGPTCAVMANRIPNIKFTVVDLNEARISAWNSSLDSDLPIYEPRLAEILRPARDGIPSQKRSANLFFTTDIDSAIAAADTIFVSVNTPTKLHGLGAGSASDLNYIESAIRRIAKVATTDKIIVEKSTVPCRTAESIADLLDANGRQGVNFEILSNPEFLAEGTAITNLLQPDRILIGSHLSETGLGAAAALADLYAEWVPRDRIITINLWSSELAKLAANALLAQRISSINALSAVCSATGANIDQISYAVGLDSRIGPKMLKSSVGFGGSCFKKDVLSLVWLADRCHLPEVAAYWRSVVDINEWQKDRFTKSIITCLYNSVKNKKVAILGFAYKKDTSDTRETAAISIVNALVAERAQVSIYDPEVREAAIWQDLFATGDDRETTRQCVTVCADAYAACQDAHAVVIVTEWDIFRVDGSTGGASNGSANASHAALTNGKGHKARQPSKGGAAARLDWGYIASIMQKPSFVFDGRNIVAPKKLEELGFRVQCIGNGGMVSH